MLRCHVCSTFGGPYLKPSFFIVPPAYCSVQRPSHSVQAAHSLHLQLLLLTSRTAPDGLKAALAHATGHGVWAVSAPGASDIHISPAHQPLDLDDQEHRTAHTLETHYRYLGK